MLRLYLVVMVLLPLLDAFDRWWMRTAIVLTPWQLLPPKRRLIWGVINNGRESPRFVYFRVPWLRTWDFFIHNLDYGWCEWIVTWQEGKGFRVYTAPAR